MSQAFPSKPFFYKTKQKQQQQQKHNQKKTIQSLLIY